MVRGEEGSDHIRNWMRNRNTDEFLELWETLNTRIHHDGAGKFGIGQADKYYDAFFTEIE